MCETNIGGLTLECGSVELTQEGGEPKKVRGIVTASLHTAINCKEEDFSFSY